MKLQESKDYACIPSDPTKRELLGDTQTPDLCKMKYLPIRDSCTYS